MILNTDSTRFIFDLRRLEQIACGQVRSYVHSLRQTFGDFEVLSYSRDNFDRVIITISDAALQSARIATKLLNKQWVDTVSSDRDLDGDRDRAIVERS